MRAGSTVTRDIYGNPVEWSPTGRRRPGQDGRMRCELTRAGSTIWPLCRPHENCVACAVGVSHDSCPVVAR